jgi:hypothetical protein
MKRLVVLTVIVIAVLTGGLALYLFWVGTLLTRIAASLEESSDVIREIDDHAKVIRPGVMRINRIGGVVAGALPLLYGPAEQIVHAVAARPAPEATDTGSAPGTRRSRGHDGVGFNPPG